MANIDNTPQDTMNCCQSKFAAFQPPCCHNSWDNVRVKGNTTTLICRICLTRWKLPHPVAIMCPEFFETRGKCPLGVSCPYLHVHRSKKRHLCPTAPSDHTAIRDDRLYTAAAHVLGQLDGLVFPSTLLDAIVMECRGQSGSPETNAGSVSVGDVHPPSAERQHPHPAGLPSTSTLDEWGSFSAESSSTSRMSTPTGRCSSEPSPQLLPVSEKYVPMQRAMWNAQHSTNAVDS